MAKKVTLKGRESWEPYFGKLVVFEWHDGWEGHTIPLELAGTEEQYGGDPRYPKYYVMDVEGGGYALSEDEEVEVFIHD